MSNIASGSKKVEQKQNAKANKETQPEAINNRTGIYRDTGSEDDAKLRSKWDQAKAAALAAMNKDKSDKRGILTKSEAAMRAATEITGYSPAERQAEEPKDQPKAAKINTSRVKKKAAVWHKFSKELAVSLNPEQPDITLALILSNLTFWMVLARRGWKPKDYCYRSLRELMKDHPYLSKGAIEHALERAEQKLKEDFKIIGGGKTLRFALSDKLMKRARAKPQLMFRIADAVKYGADKALLIANLQWQIKERNTCWVDDAGNEFYEFSSTKLSQVDPFTSDPPILPFSRWKISRLLDELCENDGVFVPCPVLSTYYGLASAVTLGGRAGQCQDGAKRDSDGAERDTNGAERDTLPWIDSNQIVNEDSKDITPPTETAPPSVCGDMASPGLRQMLVAINNGLIAFRQREKDKAGVRRTYPVVCPSQLHYDIIHRPADDLPYDSIVRDSSGHRYTRNRQIRTSVDVIASGWRMQKFPYTAKDKRDLEMLFWQIPEFTADDFDSIQQWLPANRYAYLSPDDFKKQEGKWDCFKVAKSIRNASSLLKYLPELIEEIYTDNIEWVDGKLVRDGQMPDNMQSVIEYCRNEDKPIERVMVEHESNPVLDVAA